MQLLAKLALGSLVLWLPLFGQSAQTLTIPQVVDGGGWQSTIVLTNSGGAAASATLIFHSETTGGNTQPWSPPLLEVSSTSNMVMPPSSSLYLHTSGTAAALTIGWAELNADAGVIAYVVFTNSRPAGGVQYDEGTAPAVAATNRILVPYDDANGFVTAIAVVNPTGAAQTISVGFRTVDGLVSINALPTVPAMGHTAFVLSQTFPVIAGHRGLAEFYSSTGNISMIGLRFNPTQSFTAAPVFFQTGPPLITAPPAGGGGGGYDDGGYTY
ncbi:MAG: hypothetical protein ABI833_13450 [Acidobacteriota bacterium]